MKKQSSRTMLWQRLAAAFLSLTLVSSFAFGGQERATATATATTLSATERELSEKVKIETIKEVTAALAADEMMGRGTGQAGGEKAASYLAERFARLGLKPLGDRNSYLQPIKFRATEFAPGTTLQVGKETLKLGSDYVPIPPQSGDKDVAGNLVFVAYGMVSSTPRRNDLNGVDVRGKIVVLLQGPPKNVNKASWKKAKADLSILQYLITEGAAGLIFVSNGTEEHPYEMTADYLTRRRIEPADEEEMPSFLPPFMMVSNQTAEKMFAASGVTYAQALERAESGSFEPINLKQSAKIAVRLKKGKGSGSNVVGLLEGSDPKLKNEAVVYTAHYDAYGVGADNRIYHGAADNALGVAEMLAVAEALSQSQTRPRRSIIFLAVTGEEYGGYGSDYWVNNPTWKIKQVAADINFDGMGTEVYGPVKTLVAYGAEHSSLGTMLSDVAVASDLKVIPDPMPEEKTFYRSDHYYFVKKGIPALMLLGAPEGPVKDWTDRLKAWEKTDYHQPGDIVKPDWNWDGPRTIAALGLVLGWRVANSEQMPSWLQTSPFNRERGTKEPPPPEP